MEEIFSALFFEAETKGTRKWRAYFCICQLNHPYNVFHQPSAPSGLYFLLPFAATYRQSRLVFLRTLQHLFSGARRLRIEARALMKFTNFSLRQRRNFAKFILLVPFEWEGGCSQPSVLFLRRYINVHAFS